MDERFKRWLPERVAFDLFGDRLSPTLRTFFGWTFVAVAWTSLVSFFSGLTIVFDAVTWLYDHAGSVAPVLKLVGSGVHVVVSVWRTTTEPLLSVLSTLLPFKFPRILFDALLVVGLFVGTYLKAWLATRRERRFMSVFAGVKVPLFRISNFDPEGVYSPEGKEALIKRMLAALYILDQHYSSYIHDKAERELEMALDEMTVGISDDAYAVVEEAFRLPADQMIDFLRGCAIADRVTAERCKRIVTRGIVTSAFMACVLCIDLVYVAAA